MAFIFYITNSDEANAAWQYMTGDNFTPYYEFHIPAGYYYFDPQHLHDIDEQYGFVGSASRVTPQDLQNVGRALNGNDIIVLNSNLHQKTPLPFSALDGDDTYLVTRDFGTGAAGSADKTLVELADTAGSNTLKIEDGLEITGVFKNDDHGLVLTFGNGAVINISNNALPAFSFQRGENGAQSLDDFLTTIGHDGQDQEFTSSIQESHTITDDPEATPPVEPPRMRHDYEVHYVASVDDLNAVWRGITGNEGTRYTRYSGPEGGDFGVFNANGESLGSATRGSFTSLVYARVLGNNKVFISDTFHGQAKSFSARGKDDTYIITASFGAGEREEHLGTRLELFDDMGSNTLRLEAGLEIATVFKSSLLGLSLGFENGAIVEISNRALQTFTFQRGNRQSETVEEFLVAIGHSGQNDILGTLQTAYTIPANHDGSLEFDTTAPAEHGTITVMITDPDGVEVGTPRYQFFTADDAEGAGRVDFGALSESPTLQIDDPHVGKFIGVEVTWTDSTGRQEIKTLIINTVVTGVNDNAPQFTTPTATATPLTTGALFHAGTPVFTAAATDADFGDSITYSLKAGGNADLFSIDDTTGVVSLVGNLSTDHAATPSYSFTVVATDSNGASTEQVVTLAVSDISVGQAVSSPSLVINGVEFRPLDGVTGAENWMLKFRAVTGTGTYIKQKGDVFELNFFYTLGTPERIVDQWNKMSASSSVSIARIIETVEAPGGSWDHTDWVGMTPFWEFAEPLPFTAGGAVPDYTVTEDDPDDASDAGTFDVTNADGEVIFGAAQDPGITITGTGADRKATWQGQYGTLVVNHDGAWVYTLDPGVEVPEGVLHDNFLMTIIDTGADNTLGGGDDDRVIHSLTITLNGVNDMPVLDVDTTIGVNGGEGFVLSRRQFDARDVDTVAASLVYTVTAVSVAGLLQKNNAGTWEDLAVNGTFTQEDIDNGHVRILATAGGSFGVSLHDGLTTITKQIAVELRTPAELPASVQTLEEFDFKNETKPKSVKTGLGETTFKTGTGDDEVDPGLGDDEVILGVEGTEEDGRDQVTYRFAETDDGKLVAWDGGDLIKGFTPGEDTLQLGSRSDTKTIDAFLARLDTDIKVMLDFEYKGEGSTSDLANYRVICIDLLFAEAVILPGGKLAGSILMIEFKTPIDWTVFEATWLKGDAFDETMFMFNGNDDGRAALKNILGLSLEIDQSRNAALGSDGRDTITIDDDSGDWVIFGGEGNDTINLSNGAEEVVYVLSDDGSAITATDGVDTINTFTLGTDSLRFVDSNGDAASLGDLLGRMDSVTLFFTGVSYRSMAFTVDGQRLSINFERSISEDNLKTAFGNIDDTAFAAAFDGGVPTKPGFATLTTAGLGFIDDLFGEGGISVSDTLPAELL